MMNLRTGSVLSLDRERIDVINACLTLKKNVDKTTYCLYRLRKEMAQTAKNDDKKRAAESRGKGIMITMDLQTVLLPPALKVSALYYRTKVVCAQIYHIILQFYDCTTRDFTCYVSHEAESYLTANVFASSLCHYVEKACQKRKFVIFSDGYPYQIRNATFAKTLTHMSQTHSITITHKFLEKGHTQMEVDCVHHTIEEKIKNKSIYYPSDYARYIKEARRNPFPYLLEYLDQKFFKGYTKVCGLNSTRPGKLRRDPQVVDNSQPPVHPRWQNTLKASTWRRVEGARGARKLYKNCESVLFRRQRKIAAAKFRHLQEMKIVLPRDIHAFYNSPPHE